MNCRRHQLFENFGLRMGEIQRRDEIDIYEIRANTVVMGKKKGVDSVRDIPWREGKEGEERIEV